MASLNKRDVVYLGVAENVSRLSTCQFTNVGCVITTDKGQPVSWGTNGTAPGRPHCTDIEMTRDAHAEFANDYEIHAEMNAILQSHGHDLRGCIAYTTITPCSNCLKHLAAVGITRVVSKEAYWRDVDAGVDFSERARKYGIELVIKTDYLTTEPMID